MAGTQAGPAAKRAFYIRTAEVHPESHELIEYTEDAEAFLGKMLTTLMAVGGTLYVQTDRAKVGVLPGTAEPLAATVGLVAQWTSQPGKLRELDEPAPDEPAPASAEEE